MLLTIFLISVVLVLVAFLGLGVNIFFRRNGRFPDTEIETNPAMREMGLTCARHEEMSLHHGDKGKESGGNGHHPSGGCGMGCSCAASES